MQCTEELMAKMDSAAKDFRFPAWECGEANAVVGTMRASGFHSATGVGLIFDSLEYSLKESVIQCIAYCFATFTVSKWGGPVKDSIDIDVRPTELGGPGINFGEIVVQSRGREFAVLLDRDELLRKGYIDEKPLTPTPESVLLQLRDSIPRDWLFSSIDTIKKEFGFPDDIQRVFTVDNWEHPSFKQLYGDDEMLPSEFADIRALVEAACNRLDRPNLGQTPTASWEQQCKGKAYDESK